MYRYIYCRFKIHNTTQTNITQLITYKYLVELKKYVLIYVISRHLRPMYSKNVLTLKRPIIVLRMKKMNWWE